MLNNRHYSKSYSQLNSIKNQQYINTTNKAASRSAQDLTTSWIVVDKIQQSPSKISSSYVVNNKLIGGVVDKANNTNVSNRRRSFLKNPTPSMKNIKAIPETGTSYETGIPTLEGINDTNSFEKTIASSPTNSITSSLSTTNLLSFDESNDKSEKITIHLNEDSSKKSVKSQNKKFDHIRNKPSGK